MSYDSCATGITQKLLKTTFSPFPNVTADTRVLRSGLTVFEILEAVKRNKKCLVNQVDTVTIKPDLTFQLSLDAVLC